MNILVITDVLWRTDNGVGNSYSNLFSDLPNVQVANICCQEGSSDNNVSTACYQISERRLLKNLRNKSIPSGVVEDKQIGGNDNVNCKSTLVRVLRRSRLQVLLWIRNLIWTIGRWKTPELNNFIDNFNPDIIFAQLQDKIYLNNLVKYVKEYTGKNLVLYAWDDVYSLKHFSLSPLFWIDRFAQRKSIRRVVKRASLLYTISQEQRDEYARDLNIQTKLLYKGKLFGKEPTHRVPGTPLRMIYTGNLYSGRYKTILKVARLINQNHYQDFQLDIYSGTYLSESEISRLNSCKSVTFHGSVSEEKIDLLRNESDILLHVEPSSLKGSLLCRLSFSTKLVDYFYKDRCIIALGSMTCSSMKYLKSNDAALVLNNIGELDKWLNMIKKDHNIIDLYASKAWFCGMRNHGIRDIQSSLLNDLSKLSFLENVGNA